MDNEEATHITVAITPDQNTVLETQIMSGTPDGYPFTLDQTVKTITMEDGHPSTEVITMDMTEVENSNVYTWMQTSIGDGTTFIDTTTISSITAGTNAIRFETTSISNGIEETTIFTGANTLARSTAELI